MWVLLYQMELVQFVDGCLHVLIDTNMDFRWHLFLWSFFRAIWTSGERQSGGTIGSWGRSLTDWSKSDPPPPSVLIINKWTQYIYSTEKLDILCRFILLKKVISSQAVIFMLGKISKVLFSQVQSMSENVTKTSVSFNIFPMFLYIQFFRKFTLQLYSRICFLFFPSCLALCSVRFRKRVIYLGPICRSSLPL